MTAIRTDGGASPPSAGTPRVLVVKLDTGDELEIDAGIEAGAAQEQLAAFFDELETHTFVRFDERTVVRTSQIAYMQLRERGSGGGGLVEAGKSRIGGNDMSTYGDDRVGASTGTMTGERGYGQGYGMQRRPQPIFDAGRDRGTETKPFFLTSEFLVTAGVIAAIGIAMAQLDNFDAHRGWLLITVIAAAYVVSRGIAKAGNRSYTDDPRDRIDWGNGDR